MAMKRVSTFGKLFRERIDRCEILMRKEGNLPWSCVCKCNVIPALTEAMSRTDRKQTQHGLLIRVVPPISFGPYVDRGRRFF